MNCDLHMFEFQKFHTKIQKSFPTTTPRKKMDDNGFVQPSEHEVNRATSQNKQENIAHHGFFIVENHPAGKIGRSLRVAYESSVSQQIIR